MADINFLADGAKKDDTSKKATGPQPADDVAMHVPSPAAAEPKGAGEGSSGFLGGLAEMLSKPEPAAEASADLMSQKISTTTDSMSSEPPKVTQNTSVPSSVLTRPKPSAPATPPKSPVLTPPLPRNGGGFASEGKGGTLRVSLIAGAGGGGMTEMAVRERVRTFVLVIALAAVLDGLIFGGLLYYKSRVTAEVQAAEGDIQMADRSIVEGEGKVVRAQEFQALTETAQRVLEAHNHWTRLFALIEEVALPQVQFANMSGAESGNVSADVMAADFTTLARQMQALMDDPRFSNVSITTAAADIGEAAIMRGVRSALSFTFDSDVIKAASSETLSGRFALARDAYPVGQRIQGTFTLENYGEPFLAAVTYSGAASGGYSAFELKDRREFTIDFVPARAGTLVLSYTVTKSADPTFQKVFERRIEVTAPVATTP